MTATDHLGDGQFAKMKAEIIGKRGTPASRHPERPGILYHGTHEPLETGALIRPGHPSNWEGLTQDTESKHVFATGDPTEAYHFGMHALHVNEGGGGDFGPIPTPHIYEVQPTGRMTYDPEQDRPGPDDIASSYQSRQPLRVGQEVSRMAKREWFDNVGEEWQPRD